MALKVIVLERVGEPSDMNFRVAFWVVPPAARQPYYADPSAASAYADVSASALAAIRAGAIVERVETRDFPVDTTLAQIKTALEQRWQKIQDAANSRNPWVKYGTTWDGTTWTAGGVS